LGIKTPIQKHGKTIYKGWKIDFAKLRQYLKDKYGVENAFLFIGYVPANEALYTYLQRAGYIVILKPTLEVSGKVKGNVDAELVLHAMIEYQNYDKAILASGDGDFHCLVEYLLQKKKLERVLAPNRFQCSSLLKKFRSKITYLDLLEGKLSKKKASVRSGRNLSRRG
jgi:uncharacterized LabA/DUF88 family protein